MKLVSNLVKTPNKEYVSAVKENPKWKEWLQKYEEYKVKMRAIRDCQRGKCSNRYDDCLSDIHEPFQCTRC